MDNPVFSASSIPPEGTSQIFVNPPGSTTEGFREIFIDQGKSASPADTKPGKKLQSSGNDTPRETNNEIADNRDEKWEPIFVTPPDENAAAADSGNEGTPVFVDVPGFRGEAYPVENLYSESALEVYTLSEEDIYTPVLIEPGVMAPVETTQTPEEATTTATEGIVELAELAGGNYAPPQETSIPSRVEVAALDTRPFNQPITSPTIDEQPEMVAANSGVTTAATLAQTRQQADSGKVPATNAGSLQTAIKDVTKGTEAANAQATIVEEVEAEIVPATSSGTLNGERLAELRQIQAYTENMTARANDGSNGSRDSIDIAAMSARLDRAAANTSTAQPAVHTAPQALNFTEKGWEQSFGQNIQWMSANNIKSAQIRINPAELGPVKIDLSMHKDQLTLQINATHQITRDTLEAALPRLRTELAEQGFSNANIGMGDPGAEQQTGQQGQADEDVFSDETIVPSDENGEAAEVIPATSAANLMSGSVSLLDTFA